MSDSSSSAAATTRRKYVDPWDLDLREASRRHSSDTTDCSADLHAVSLSSAAGPVSARSDFVYVPGGDQSAADGPSDVRHECCQCSPGQSVRLRRRLPVVPSRPADSYEYWEPATGGRRELPTRPPQPQTPYGYAVDERFYAAGSSDQCRLVYNDVSGPADRRNSRNANSSDADSTCPVTHQTSSGEYDAAGNAMITGQFRYNTLGHVKIDYSSNWNNLDKYICRV